MKELVSAIITTHNRIELLPRAIKSVQEQTYPNIELIVVDDASSDGTYDYCQKQSFQYIYIPKDESKGGNHARNVGVLAAKGEYVAFLDDDDYWLPTKIEKQMKLMEAKDCELVHCGRRLEFVKEGEIKYMDIMPSPEHYGDMGKRILLTICTTTTCILAKRHAIIDVGMFDEELKFWQEYELTIRLAQRKPFYFVNEPLSVYRVDEGDSKRLTNKYKEWKEAVKYIHLKHKELYKKLDPLERVRVWILVLADAKERTRGAGLKWKHFLLNILWNSLYLPYKTGNNLKHLMTNFYKSIK